MTEILLCGSAVIDMVFEVEAFPAAPEKYTARDARIVGGGCAGNAAVAVARLGARARLAARLGDDLIGRLMRDQLDAEGVDTGLFQVAAEGRSAFSSILVDGGGERQIVAFRGGDLPVALPAEGLGRPDAVLADTRWPEAAAVVLGHARAAGVPGVLDGEAPVPADLVRIASHVGFSAQGLRDFTGEADLEAGLLKAAEGSDAWLCVTDGARGALFGRGGRFERLPGFEVAAVDTLGAGDVWHGAFALRLGEGADERASVRFANAAAALKCTRPGGREGAPGRAETEEFLRRMTTCS